MTTWRLGQPGPDKMVDLSFASVRVLATHALPVKLDP
jgi:hypothetical protein